MRIHNKDSPSKRIEAPFGSLSSTLKNTSAPHFFLFILWVVQAIDLDHLFDLHNGEGSICNNVHKCSIKNIPCN